MPVLTSELGGDGHRPNREGGQVLTMKLGGTGVVQRVGDVAAHPSSGLLRGPPRFRALCGRHRVSRE